MDIVKGTQVRVIATGEICVISEIIERRGQYLYKVFKDGKTSTMQAKYFELFVDEESQLKQELLESRFGNKNDYEIFQTWTRLKKPYEGNLYSYLNSKTVFNPFQFRPLMKFLHGQSMERLFIADEVGVGKTIESGIIITELLARNRIHPKQPVIVVCPSILGPKWQKEMSERFNLRFELHNKDSFKILLENIRTNQLQPHQMFHIVSMQMMRGEDILQLLEELNNEQEKAVWSLSIIDEAHHMRNSGTMSNRLGHLTSDQSEMQIMLSATPLNLKDEDLFQLMHILNPYLYPDIHAFTALIEPIKNLNRFIQKLFQNNPSTFNKLQKELEQINRMLKGLLLQQRTIIELHNKLSEIIPFTAKELAQYERILKVFNPLEASFTRTLKKEAFEQVVVRDAVKVPVYFTEEEKGIYDDIIEFAIEQFEFYSGTMAGRGFVTNLPRRMASSCLPVMVEYLNKSLIPKMIMEENMEDIEDDSVITYEVLPAELMKRSKDIIRKINNLTYDSKYNELLKTITYLFEALENKQIIIFSFFTRTVAYLKNKLEADGYSVGVITGKTPTTTSGDKASRYDIIDDFKNKKFDILLASDVGGEGLDFQFCQSILNYDLPYNPMKVEQRIGRIDRFGQKAEKIFVANMYLADTVDERIYELLYERVNLIHDSIGMFEPIIGKEIEALQNNMISGELSELQQEEKLKTLMLSIEKTKLEQEQFDHQRKELYGDDAFNSIISGITKKNDFLTPQDAAKITAYYFELKKIPFEYIEENKMKVVMNDSIIKELSTFLRKPGNEGSQQELNKIINNKKHIFQFNGSQYDESKETFIPITGYWIRFVLSELESEKSLYQIFKFALNAKDVNLPPGSYSIPIFNVEVSGMQESNHLGFVPVVGETGIAVDVNYLEFGKNLSAANEIESIGYDLIMHDEAIEEAEFAIEGFMENYIIEIQFEQNILVETRVLAIEQGSAAKVKKTRQILNDYLVNKSDERYIRMLEKKIENEENRAKEKVRALKANQQLAHASKLIGLIEVFLRGE